VNASALLTSALVLFPALMLPLHHLADVTSRIKQRDPTRRPASKLRRPGFLELEQSHALRYSPRTGFCPGFGAEPLVDCAPIDAGQAFRRASR
jgi:hypothetical protein